MSFSRSNRYKMIASILFFLSVHAKLTSTNFKAVQGMKNKGRKRIEGNVVLFPDLEKRLLDKGLERLQQKKYTEAIRLFEEAKELSPDDADVYIGLVLAYYESGALQKAKQLAHNMLKEGIGEYFQTVDLYLMILIQLHKYEEIITTINVLQEEKEIPFEKQEHFSKLLAFSRRMLDNSTRKEDESDFPTEKSLDLLESGDPNKQVLMIAELSQKNIRPYIEEVRNYLKSEQGHPFLKTMLCNILQEQEFEKEVRVKKFDWEKTMIPSQLAPFQKNEQLLLIKQELAQIESTDPVLYQHIISLLERHFFLIFPFELQPEHPLLWAAVYHLIGLQFNGVEKSIEEIAEQYQVESLEMEKAYTFITKLEEISYPII